MIVCEGAAETVSGKRRSRKNPRPQHISEIEGRIWKKRRMRNGTRALTNIRRYQKSGDPLLCKSHMQKLIRAFVGDKATTKLKIEKDAFHVLQMETERFIQYYFQQLNFVSLGPEFCLHNNTK